MEEYDYGMAHRFTNCLTVAYQQLQVLYHLQDPWREAKTFAARQINRMESSLLNSTGSLHRFYLERLAEERNKLAEFQAQANARAAALPVTQLHEVLTKLLQGRISAFTWMIDPNKRLQFNIRLVRQTMLIILPEIQRHRADYVIEKKQIRLFQALGFRYYDQRDKLLLFTPFTLSEDVARVKTILARMMLDGFTDRELFEHSFISYREDGPG